MALVEMRALKAQYDGVCLVQPAILGGAVP
jgi:hypothetical protein